jgi:hypothetical protein
MAFFVTSCQLAFSYSLNIGEQDYLCWLAGWLLTSDFDFTAEILPNKVLC